MDKITKSLLSDFLNSQEINSSNDSDDFEKFANYSVISNEYTKTFDVDLVSVGSGGDTGIDGLGIIVNGHLIDDTDEVDELLSNNGFLEATFIFIQSKTSSKFSTSEMHNFFFGVKDFFSEQPKLPQNTEIKNFSELSNYLFEQASEFRENPKLKIFYVSTGRVNDDDSNINAVLGTAKQDLIELNLFDSVDISLIGANELAQLYRKTKNPISTSFKFSNKITLPEIDGVDQAYFGGIPFLEFKKLLIDSNDNILNVFEDNVRDYQGANAVNKNISETLSSETPNLFSVLNNGVTVVADSIKTSGDTFTISDFQIVNGCQTSNVLYESRGVEGVNNIFIPLRLIVTSDDEVKSQITVSTNSQTAIKREQLSAMTDFQRNLEHYYSSISGDGKLYYERRAKQYNSDRTVIKRRIITVANQIKSYSSMFQQNPHMVTTYFGSLAKKMGTSGSGIFEEDHMYAPYYLAGLAFYRLDSLFNSGDVDKKYKKVKFYLTMLVPLIASTEEFPPMNSLKKTEKYCDPIIQKLNNDDECKKIFSIATDIVDRSGAQIEDKQSLKSKTMTIQILDAFDPAKDRLT